MGRRLDGSGDPIDPMDLCIQSYIKGAIDSRMCVKKYAKSGANGANVSFKRYARNAALAIGNIEADYDYLIDTYYDRDRNGNYYCIEQDEVVEVLTEEQVKTRLTSYFEYINTFIRVSNVRKNIAFQIYKILVA